MTRKLEIYEQSIVNSKSLFNKVLTVSSINYTNEAFFASQIIKKNEYLMKIANQNPESLRNAVINVASIGISLNPASKLAYLIPRKGECCLDISYLGLIKLATDTGSIKWARAELVHENDVFVYHGATEKPEFSTPNAFERGRVVGVYCVAKTYDDDYLSGVMSSLECYKIRDLSEAWKRNRSGPWALFEGEMMKKCILKRDQKTWPRTNKSERLDNAIDVLNKNEEINFVNSITGEEVNEKLVEETYIEIVNIITTDDDEPESYIRVKELFCSLTNDEQLKLNSKLRNYKPLGSRQYNTLLREYLEWKPSDIELIENINN